MNGSLITRIGMALLSEGFLAAAHADDEKVRAEQDQKYEDKRERAAIQMAPATEALRHTDVPEEMIRLAAVGVDVGAELAKTAGIGLTSMEGVASLMRSANPKAGLTGALNTAKAVGQQGVQAAKSLGQQGVQAAKNTMGKASLVVGGGTLAAGALGAYGINKGVQALGQPAPEPATFGGGRFGQQLSYGVNQYGVPALGTPLY
jgi:hypothetical protein